ncbi:MAG: AraC family transcriptional regulator [Eubacteriales bacterium]|nr:AraC family transcriptional regulator [Eubacteriales bacterium]
MEFQHELIIPDEGMPFKMFPFEGGTGSYVRERHWHTSIEIFAVMEGELCFFLNGKEIPLTAGHFIIINSNEVHSIHARQANDTAVLQIPLEQFENYYTADRFIRFHGGDREAQSVLAGKIRELFAVYQEKALGWEYRSLALYNEILYQMICHFRIREVGDYEVKQSRRLDDLSRITGYMKEHYRDELTLSKLAEQFGYSDAYLSRMFRKYAQVNFKSYLQDLRTAYAYRDLVNTDHTIARIAEENGFCSSRSLTEEFRKRYGLLPSEIRKKKTPE